MIDKTHRFHGQGSLRFVLSRGQRVHGAIMSLRYAPNNKQPGYRAAVVVSRKVNKSAVVRNRVRRRLYEIIRTNSDRIVEPYDLVFIVYGQEVAELPNDDLAGMVVGQLARAKVLKPTGTSTPDTNHDIVNLKETSL